MHLLEIKYRHIMTAVLACPAVASVLCLLISVTYHSEISGRTNCRPRVDNILPSLSTVVTELTPERYIWRWFIALHTVPRLVVAIMYRNLYMDAAAASGQPRLVRLLAPSLAVLHWLENFAILGASYVTLKESAWFHENMSAMFVGSSVLYMAVMCALDVLVRGAGGGRTQTTAMERRSIRYKRAAFLANITFYLLAYYFHERHEAHCEPYMHSYFALCEYLGLVTNMLYHFTAYWDFYDQSLYAVPGDEEKFN